MKRIYLESSKLGRGTWYHKETLSFQETKISGKIYQNENFNLPRNLDISQP